MKKELKQSQPIIATHPLFGPDSVKKLGLGGQKIVVAPVRVTEEQLKVFEEILEKMKLKIIHATPEEHDQQMARSQALVHFLGRGLAELDLQDQEISTPDYQSLLRINDLVTNDTWQLFLDMQRYNPYAQTVRKELIEALQKLDNNIQSYE
jgi:prephenate dehydrogenase